MNTYTCTVRIKVTDYMEDDYRVLERNHTVSASSEEEAESKVYKYYDDRSDTYGTMYNVSDVDIWSHIE